MLVNPVPLSLTTDRGLPRRSMMASSSRLPRVPDREVSATRPKHSRVKSSTTARMRNPRQSLSWIGQEVERPTLVLSLREQEGCPCSQGSLAAAASAHHEPLLAIVAAELLVVQVEAVPPRQDQQPALAEATALRGQLTQPGLQDGIIRPNAAIAHARSKEYRGLRVWAMTMETEEVSHGTTQTACYPGRAARSVAGGDGCEDGVRQRWPA
ncbi:conserved hypothetical protein [Candidatus Defluviicoccus seviourii]|uniref:Uncharacterized protein n=1 Tax=Candidatus Defluviicoccus seviourii TaxID=2565273 RepID=A0A564WGY1_9PROT|nr:conserved hypothetical protein [Candidatus Defluviicoccus seviourii]